MNIFNLIFPWLCSSLIILAFFITDVHSCVLFTSFYSATVNAPSTFLRNSVLLSKHFLAIFVWYILKVRANQFGLLLQYVLLHELVCIIFSVTGYLYFYKYHAQLLSHTHS
jgi:hypothetical protein